MKKEQIQIDTEFIRLDSLLKLSGGAVTGGQAKVAIQAARFWSTARFVPCGAKKCAPAIPLRSGSC